MQPKPTLTFSKCLEMGLEEHKETITKVADVAGKEYSIEQVSNCHQNRVHIKRLNVANALPGPG